MRWIAIAAALVLTGCSEITISSSGEGNDAEKDVRTYTEGKGYVLDEVSCPGMKGTRADYDGKSIACTATAQMPDGTTRPIKLRVAYEKCSISGIDSCQNIDITGDIKVRVRPN